MDTKCFYFTFHIEASDKDWVADDYSVIETAGVYFPITDVKKWAQEIFGDNCKFLVTNVFEISNRDFKQLVSDIENE